MPTEATRDAAHGGPARDVQSLKWQVQVCDSINVQYSRTEIAHFQIGFEEVVGGGIN